MKLREFFDRIYVLNLPSRPDRRREMTAELDRVGLSVEPGKVEFFDALRFDQDGGFPSVGARGCFASHLSILRRARDLRLRNVCVIEDDQNFLPRFGADQGALLEQLSAAEWGMAHFGYRIPMVDTNAETLALGRLLATTPVGRPERAAFYAIEPYEHVLTTAFYGVNGPILERVIGCLEGIMSRPAGHPEGGPMHVDGAYNTFRLANPDVPACVATPVCSEERPSRSDVTPGRLDRVAILRPMVQAARSAKRLLLRRPGVGSAACS